VKKERESYTGGQLVRKILGYLQARLLIIFSSATDIPLNSSHSDYTVTAGPAWSPCCFLLQVSA